MFASKGIHLILIFWLIGNGGENVEKTVIGVFGSYVDSDMAHDRIGRNTSNLLRISKWQ